MKNYCCQRMAWAVANKDNPVEYNPIFREYNVRMIYNTIALERLNYCPWCAYKFPTSLRDVFFEIIESEYDIEDGVPEIFENKKLPDEFKSEAWWIKREL